MTPPRALVVASFLLPIAVIALVGVVAMGRTANAVHFEAPADHRLVFSASDDTVRRPSDHAPDAELRDAVRRTGAPLAHQRAEALIDLTRLEPTDGFDPTSLYLSATRDPDASVRRIALGSLETVVPLDETTLQVILVAATDPVPTIRDQALFLLRDRENGRMSAVLAEESLAPLPDQLKGWIGHVFAAGGTGRSERMLGRLLRDESPEVRREAVQTILEMESGSLVLNEELVALLDDPDDRVAEGAAVALERSGYAVEHVGVLIAALERSGRAYPMELIRAFSNPALDPLRTVEGLAALLDSPEGVVRARAAMALGRVGPSAESALPRLREISTHDEFEEARATALQAVEEIENGLY